MEEQSDAVKTSCDLPAESNYDTTEVPSESIGAPADPPPRGSDPDPTPVAESRGCAREKTRVCLHILDT